MKGKGTPIRPTHPRTVKTLQQHKEKKLDATGASKIAKPPTKRPELFEIQKSLPTSLETFSDLIETFNTGTDDLRQLLDFECAFIYECKVCRNLFRSLANFIQHKRAYCFERFRDFKMKFEFNGEIVDKVVHLNGNNPKGLMVATRKTMRKDIYELLKKVGNLNEEISPAPEHLYTKEIEKTEAALHTFFQQEGKAPSEERIAVIGPDGFIINPQLPQPETVKDTKPAQPSPLAAKTTAVTDAQSERKVDANKRHKCLKCKEAFSSLSDFNLHTSLRACSQMRCYYACPVCQKAVHSPYSVYRHLRRVHNKSRDQVEKLRSKIRKKLVKDPKSWKNKNSATSPVSDMKVRPYGKSPLRQDLTLPAFMRKQPLVVLTKTVCPSSMTSFSISSSSASAPSTGESSRSGCRPHPESSLSASQPQPDSSTSQLKSSRRPNPRKKARVEKDLSWLKRGPTAPIVGAPLTRTARALYGSPKKMLSTLELSREKFVENITGFGSKTSKDDVKNEVSPESHRKRADHRDTSPNDDTDDDEPKGDDDGESLVDASIINKRLSSSGDIVRSLTSSVHSFDSSSAKVDGEKIDVNDRASTSGIETDLSPYGDQVTPSQSDDESSDVDRLVNLYQIDSSPFPPKLIPCNRPSSADRVSDTGSLGSAEDNGSTSDERSSSVRLGNITASRLGNITTSKAPKLAIAEPPKADKPPPILARQDPNRPVCVNRTGDEIVSSKSGLVSSIRPTEGKRRFSEDEQSDSEDCVEEQQADDALRSNMMDIIFGSLPTSCFRGLSDPPDDLSS